MRFFLLVTFKSEGKRHLMATRKIVPHPSGGVYSPSVTCHNEIIFVSGQLGCINAPENQTFQDECRAAMTKLQAVLEQSQSSLALATMCTVYLTDITNYGEFNEVYKAMLVTTGANDAPPCRACFAIAALPLNGRVEIECEAITQAAAATRQVVVPGVPNLFSAAVAGGRDRVVWVAGQLSMENGTLTGGDDVALQTTGALANVKSVLAQAGSSMSAIFRSTVFLTNMNQYAPMNEVYGTTLGLTGENPSMLPPTRAAFAVTDLPLGGLVEIACVAASSAEHNQTLPGLSASPVYSPAVTTGIASKMVWISGQVALDPASGTTELVGAGDVALETKQTLDNLKSVVEQSGCAMESVLKVNIYCANMGEYGTINEVYSSYFGKQSPPARACVQVKELPLGARVEMSCVAVEVAGSGL
jgi:2-iminobutanoate/2-iminopropanoate deaminase